MFPMRRLLLPVLALASLYTAPTVLAAEPPLVASEQSVYVEKLCAEDARLSQTVTVRGKQIYLGALLKQISEQSGIILTVSDKGRAADTQVTVFAKAMPVGDVMDRLWSLLSYKGALWYWEKQEGAGETKPSYQLVRSLAARDFPARMEGRLQAKMEQDMEEALNALSLPKDQLAGLGKRNKAIDSMANDARCYSEMSALNAALTRDEIRALMRGEKEFTLPLGDLPQAVRNYVAAENKLSPMFLGGAGTGGNFDSNGVFQLPSPSGTAMQPNAVNLVREDSGSDLMPNIWFRYGTEIHHPKDSEPRRLPDGNYAMGGGSVSTFVGGVVSGGVPQERAWCDFQEDLWMLPVDKKTSPEQNRKVPVHKEDLDAASIDDSLEQLANRTKLAVFARVLPSDPFVRSEPRTTAAYLKFLREGVYAYKWRGDSVLVADGRWWRYELLTGAKYPPGLLRQIEEDMLRDPQQMLPLSTVCRIASEKEKGIPLILPGVGMEPWQPVFASLVTKPELLTELQTDSGVSCNRLPETARRAVYEIVREKTKKPPALSSKRIRVQVEDQVTEKTVTRFLRIMLLTDGKADLLADILLGQREVSAPEASGSL